MTRYLSVGTNVDERDREGSGRRDESQVAPRETFAPRVRPRRLENFEPREYPRYRATRRTDRFPVVRRRLTPTRRRFAPRLDDALRRENLPVVRLRFRP